MQMAQQRRVPNPSIAQGYHTDALHCIFAFLGLKDLPAVSRSCRDWRVAVAKEPPRSLRLAVNPAGLPALLASPLRRHVAEVGSRASLVDAPRQLRLLHALPRLATLRCGLDSADLQRGMGGDADNSREQRVQPLRDALPPQLRRFDVTTSPDGRSSFGMQALLDSLPAMARLTDLQLRNFYGSDSLDVSPLLQLGRPAAARIAAPAAALTELRPFGLHPDCWADLRGFRQLRTLLLCTGRKQKERTREKGNQRE